MTLTKSIKINFGHWMTGSDWQEFLATQQIDGEKLEVKLPRETFHSPIYGRNTMEDLWAAYPGWTLHKV